MKILTTEFSYHWPGVQNSFLVDLKPHESSSWKSLTYEFRSRQLYKRLFCVHRQWLCTIWMSTCFESNCGCIVNLKPVLIGLLIISKITPTIEGVTVVLEWLESRSYWVTICMHAWLRAVQGLVRLTHEWNSGFFFTVRVFKIAFFLLPVHLTTKR